MADDGCPGAWVLTIAQHLETQLLRVYPRVGQAGKGLLESSTHAHPIATDLGKLPISDMMSHLLPVPPLSTHHGTIPLT